MSAAEGDPYSTIFSSLKHPTRRLVLRSLAHTGPKRFSQLQTELKVDSPSLSYHLDALQGLVEKKNEIYSLTELGVAALSLMRRVEEPPSQRQGVRRADPTRLSIAWAMVFLLVGFGTLGLFFTTTNDNPAMRWLYSTHSYNLQPGSETGLFVEIKYDSMLQSTLQNGEFVGGIERPSSTPWADAVNYASFSVYFQNGTVKYWLTSPNGQLAPDRSRWCNPPCDQYSPQTMIVASATGGSNTLYTEMVDEGNYSLFLQNTGQGAASGNVTLGPSRVVYSKPFFFIGILFLLPSTAFIGVSTYSALGPRLSNWRQRHRVRPK